MDGYVRAKRAIFDRQTARDIAVVGIDDAHARAMAESLRAQPARLVTISGHSAADVYGRDGILYDADGLIIDLARAPALAGTHNAQNAAAAAALARGLGLTRTAIAAGIATYPGLPHRQELVATHHGISFVNDSKATNADSTACALTCFPRVVWIAGGQAKAGGIESLAPLFPRIAEALLIGRDAPILAATLAAHGVPHRSVGTLEAAVAAAWDAARAGAAPVVLLSPACASWDQFRSFEHRGDRFRELAQQLGDTT
jgi:UDP-N-acetylmuramoylalanine--D-glutamate ligase